VTLVSCLREEDMMNISKSEFDMPLTLALGFSSWGKGIEELRIFGRERLYI
jgi:hypothetical protein